MSAPPLVSYSEGMFSNEPMGEYGSIALLTELEATCYHEGSHAVADYLFGRSLSSIGICATYSKDDNGCLMVAYDGEVLVRARDNRSKIMIDFPYRQSHFYLGCVLASGPAGERRYRHESGIPMRLLRASEGDHTGISNIGKALHRRGRCRYAYQRHVWYHAQKLVADATVWSAITDVGNELYWESCEQMTDENIGTHWSYIDPRALYSICRRAGLKRGMLRAASPSAKKDHHGICSTRHRAQRLPEFKQKLAAID